MNEIIFETIFHVDSTKKVRKPGEIFRQHVPLAGTKLFTKL